MTTPASNSTLFAELKSNFDALKSRIEAAVPLSKHQQLAADLQRVQTQVDGIDVKIATRIFGENGFGGPSTLLKTIQECEGLQRLVKDKRGRAVLTLKGSEVSDLMERKTIISNVTSGSSGTDSLNPVGASTSGVLTIDRQSGITPEARQVLTLRNALTSRPTSQAIVDFVKVSSPLAIASPVPEGSVKPENSLSFSTVSEKVRLLATWIPATRQVLDDFSELMSFIQSSLPYYVNLAEERQMLSGDGTGENLHGILSQASSFNSGLLPPASKGWQRLDVIATAVSQVNAALELPPTFVVMHPNDWWQIVLTKNSQGNYLLGNPSQLTNPTLFGLTVIPTVSIAVGTFLVGSGSPVAIEIVDRMEMQIEISSEHQDFFTRNLIAIRAEKRVALLTRRPASFITGTFTTSP